MKERPIICSGFSVNAILEGRKTQTRRIIKPQPITLGDVYDKPYEEPKGAILEWRGEVGGKCPYGSIGDRLWVREAWFETGITNVIVNSRHKFYKATYKGDLPIKWKSPLFMPRWASRITLEITNVRVERLQDITEEDARAEGLLFDGQYYLGAPHKIKGTPKVFPEAVQAFESLWDSINGKRASWDSNPFVWVIEFKQLSKGTQ